MTNSKVYKNRYLDCISYPMGGIGSGMICLQGNGGFSTVSVRNKSEYYNEPNMFAAICLKGEQNIARVLEGPVPIPKIWGGWSRSWEGSGQGLRGKNYGLPRFRECAFSAQFPFARVSLADKDVPVKVEIEGFSPFIPGNADDSSLPAIGVKYTFRNDTDRDMDAVFYFSAMQFMGVEGGEKSCFVRPCKNGVIFEQERFDYHDYNQGAFAVTLDCDAAVNAEFYRGGWWDPLTMRWNTIAAGEIKNATADDEQSPGGAAEAAIVIPAHGTHAVTVRFNWYVPNSDQNYGAVLPHQGFDGFHPWYISKYASVYDAVADFDARYDMLYAETKRFSEAFYETDLDDAVVEAVAANLCILKTTTTVRQEDGRFWGWEGTHDFGGSCQGSCQHVWNYAQALPHLFPDLERSMRQYEFDEDMNEEGHQTFRASLPIRKTAHDFYAASDGQPGGIMKLYREWHISGDTAWLAGYWEKMVLSMEYCIRTWDPQEEGVIKEPHHNTYDIEFWGADGMCTSFYLGALKAAAKIAEALGHDGTRYAALYQKGREYMETKLWNGEYFYQASEWKNLQAKFDDGGDEVCVAEGPKYQYGNGCLSDGVCGAWLAKECFLGDILDPAKVKHHLLSVYKYNFRRSLHDHANPQRPGYAIGNEGGLLICSWPKGGKPSIPFPYSDEVWTGVEYQVAAHLASFGCRREALDIITTLRARYDGERRNPYNEYECGHWYARAMASYALLHEFSGVSYDGVTKTLYAGGNNCKVFLATDGGYGVVTVKDGTATLNVVSGKIDVENTVVTE